MPPTTASILRMRGPYRPRAIRTCLQCRALKIKCDRNHPCGGCTQSGADCSYPPVPPQASPTTLQDSPRDHEEDSSRGDDERDGQKRMRVGIKRPRVSLSCTRCRRLKQRCDTKRPCGGCVRGHVEGLCEFGSTKRPTDQRDGDGDDIVQRRPLAPHPSSSDSLRSMTMLTASPIAQAVDGVAHSFRAVANSPLALKDTAPVLPSVGAKLDELLPLLPSGALAFKLLREFRIFDVMFRFVHQPSFQRRAATALDSLSHATLPDVPFLAMISAAFLCTSTVSTQPDIAALERPQRALAECLLWLCEDAGLYTIDYVHALLLMCAAHLGGMTSSPAKMFLALGKAYHAAILTGIHLDTEGEGVFDREIRRRLWCHITLQRDLMADKIHLHSHPDMHSVPRPLVISDDELDRIGRGEHAAPSPHVTEGGFAEWAHIEAKADMTLILIHKRALMRDDSIPLLSRLTAAEALVTDYTAAMPPLLGTRPLNTPHWAWMQRYLLELWVHDIVVQLYHPYFGSLDSEIASHALLRALDAAHRLVEATKGMLSFLLFDYADAPSAALWTYTMKSFTAGLVMAYALLIEPNAPGAAAHAAALDSMIGALRSCLPMGGSTTSNRQALSILENLRARIKGDAVDEVAGVTDPYTAKSYALPFMPNIQNILPGEWVEWETLFRDLLESS